MAAHREPLHWLSLRHGYPLKPVPPSKQSFDVPTHGLLSRQLEVVSQLCPGKSPPEQVPIVASVLHTGWLEHLLGRRLPHWRDALTRYLAQGVAVPA